MSGVVPVRGAVLPRGNATPYAPWRLVTWDEIQTGTLVSSAGTSAFEAPADEMTHSLRYTGSYVSASLARTLFVPLPWAFYGPAGEFCLSLQVDPVGIDTSLGTDIDLGAGDITSPDLPVVLHTRSQASNYRQLRTRTWNVGAGTTANLSSAGTVTGAAVPRALMARGRVGDGSTTQRVGGHSWVHLGEYPQAPDIGGQPDEARWYTSTTQAQTSLGILFLLSIRGDSSGPFSFDLPVRIYARDYRADGIDPTV